MILLSRSSLIYSIILFVSLYASSVLAAETYGAHGADQLTDEQLTLPIMLTHAIEDEFLARGEYQVVIEQFGERRPFSNIIKAEERHIALLLPLFESYDVDVPEDQGVMRAAVPDSFAHAVEIGIDAEIANIAMYKRFLEQDLSDDIREAFEILLAGSENHLRAFSRQKARQ
jgi:hypothetical protein